MLKSQAIVCPKLVWLLWFCEEVARNPRSNRDAQRENMNEGVMNV